MVLFDDTMVMNKKNDLEYRAILIKVVHSMLPRCIFIHRIFNHAIPLWTFLHPTTLADQRAQNDL